MLVSVDFGEAFAGLGSVGYKLLNPDGTTYQARTTLGVVALGHGKYQANPTLPSGWQGTAYWDTSSGSSINAADSFIVPYTPNELSDALLDRVSAIEPGVTVRQALRALAAVLAGTVTGATGSSATITFHAIGGSADRVTAVVDAAGNRTSITLDL